MVQVATKKIGGMTRTPITVKLPPLLVLWLRTRPEGVTGTIQQLIEAELDKTDAEMET